MEISYSVIPANAGIQKFYFKILNLLENMIKAVVFDMDNLLIDSEPFWKDAEKEIFALVGIELTYDMMCQTV